MPRGGKRLNAGAKFKWKHGKTKTIRVPVVLVEKVLAFAHSLDEEVSNNLTDETVRMLELSSKQKEEFNGESYKIIQTS